MTTANDYANGLRFQMRHQGIGDLDGESLLDLQSMGKVIDQVIFDQFLRDVLGSERQRTLPTHV